MESRYNKIGLISFIRVKLKLITVFEKKSQNYIFYDAQIINKCCIIIFIFKL